MKKYFNPIIAICVLLITSSCNKDTFAEINSGDNIGEPKNLLYPEVFAREFSAISTNIPSIDSNGVIPVLEIVSARKEDGTILDDSYMKFVSILGTEDTERTVKIENQIPGSDPNYTVTDSRVNGVVEIQDQNNFELGDYYFTIKATTEYEGKTYTETFVDVLHINVNPHPATLLYSPVAQNLVVGATPNTSAPFITGGNPEITFGLGSDTDKLSINPENGVISLLADYTTIENDTIYPVVQSISKITGEITEYSGDGFLWIVASNTEVQLPRAISNFFQPSFEAVGKQHGYVVDVITEGAPNNVWTQSAPSNLLPILDPDAPDVPNRRSIVTNLVASNPDLGTGKWSVPHESDAILNSQNLSIYKFGFDVDAVFYYYNQYVEYHPIGDPEEGKSPTGLEVYISFDYNGDNSSASWTLVNDQITSQVETNASFSGMSYPGPWTTPYFTDFKREADKNVQKSDGKWCRAVLDLNPFLSESNFTLKFKFASYFDTPTKAGGGRLRGGRFGVSDVYYIAKEI